MRKFFCILLCCIVLFVSWAHPASALVVVDDLAAAAIAVLSALGLTFVFSGLSASGALDKVSGLLDDYAGSIGESVAAWLGTYDITMFGGKLRLAAGLATKLYGFGRWVRDTYGVADNSSVDIESMLGGYGVYLQDGSLLSLYPFQRTGNSSRFTLASLNDCPNYYAYGDPTIYFASGAYIESIVYNGDDNIQLVSKTGNVVNRGNYNGAMLVYDLDNNQIRWSNLLNRQSGDGYEFHVWSNDVTGVFDGAVSSDESRVGVDAGVISIPVDAAVDDVLVDMGSIPVGTTVSGVTDIIIDQALAGALDTSIEETADLPPVVQPEAVGDYTIDLTSFFPFCIPFDVYDAITLFSASPVAPNMHLGMEWQGTEYGFDIDLSPFDSVAVLLRRLEVVAFIVGLAVTTRKYIKW